MAIQVNLERSQSSTMGYELPFTKDGIGINITDFKIYFTLKTKQEDSDANAKVNKIITSHTDAINGKTLIEFSASDTAGLLGNYYYSIEFKDTSEKYGEDTLFEGRMKITKNTRITRD